MSPTRARRVLLWAIAASLLLHLIFAFAVRWPSPREAQPQEVTVTHARIIAIRHAAKVLPTAAPRPRAAVAPVAPKRALPKNVVPPHLSRGARGVAAAVVAAATAAPSPPPSVAACDAPNAPAALAGSPPPVPTIAPSVRAKAISGTTRVAVQIDPSGSVRDARVAASSGSTSLDVAALSMAKGATYAPARLKCKAVAGDYTFSVKWVAW